MVSEEVRQHACAVSKETVEERTERIKKLELFINEHSNDINERKRWYVRTLYNIFLNENPQFKNALTYSGFYYYIVRKLQGKSTTPKFKQSSGLLKQTFDEFMNEINAQGYSMKFTTMKSEHQELLTRLKNVGCEDTIGYSTYTLWRRNAMK